MLQFYDVRHKMLSMKYEKSLNQMREDFLRKISTEGQSVSAIALELGLEQASLSRFKDGKQGLSWSGIIALYEYIYGVPFPPSFKEACR